MTPLDELRFEELSERWLQGDESCLDELRAHAAADPAMALELRLMEQSREEMPVPDASERALIERVAQRISHRAPVPRHLSRVAMVAAALLVLTGTASAAYLAGVYSGGVAPDERPTPEQRPTPGKQPTPGERTTPTVRPESPTAVPAPTPIVNASGSDHVLEGVGLVRDREPDSTAARSTPRHAAVTTPRHAAPSAADLFARANSARRQGHAREAARLYRELQARHRASPEGLASRLSLARLLLTRLHDASGALGELDAYLHLAPHGQLGPDCRYQRTVALRQLGRAGEEREALELSLREDPGSVYAPTVRRRLEELNRGEAHASQGEDGEN